MKGLKDKNIFSRGYHVFVLAALFAATLFLSVSTGLYLDDYTYRQAAVCGWPQIMTFLKWHISFYNGRTLMHILAMLFLRTEAGMAVWKVLCPLSLCLCCAVMAKIASDKTGLYKPGVVIVSLLFALTNVYVWSQSIYWLTGYFNYFFPSLLFLLLMLLTIKKPQSGWIFPLALICGATTEQVGMVTFGFFVLVSLDYLIRNKKLNRRFAVCAAVSLAGYTTVLAGTLNRVATQPKLSAAGMVENCFRLLRETWFGNINMFVYIVLMLVLSCVWLYRLRNTNKFTKAAAVPLIVTVGLLTLWNTALKLVPIALGVLGVSVSYPDALNKIFFVIWIIYAVLYFVLLALSAILIYYCKKGKNSAVPLICLILGLGSVIMLCVAGRTDMRTSVTQIMLFAVSAAWSVLNLYNDRDPNRAKKIMRLPWKRIAVCLCVVMLAVMAAAGQGALHRGGEGAPKQEIKPLTSAQMEDYIKEKEKDFINFYSNPKSKWNNTENNIRTFENY